MLAGRRQGDRGLQEGGTLAEAWEAATQTDREGQDHGGSRTLIGRQLHWSQPSRALAWEALPLLGFVLGVSGPFPRQRLRQRKEHEGQTCSQSSPTLPRYGVGPADSGSVQTVCAEVCMQTQACDTPSERSEDDGGVTGPHAKQVLPKALCPLPGGDLQGLPGAGGPGAPACLLSWPRQLQSANLAGPSPPAPPLPAF